MATISGDFSTGLKGYWKMDETSGDRADATGNGHTAVDNNTVGSTTGIIENSADFVSANSEYLEVADSADWDFGTGDFAISFWINFDSSLQGWAMERYDYDTNNRSWHLYSFAGTGANGTRWTVSTTGSNDQTVLTVNLTGDLSPGTWHHFVITRNSSVTKLYLDGVEKASASDSRNYYNATAPVWFGANPTTAIGVYLDGKMDEIGIWKGRGLSSTDVSTIYNSGSGIPYEATAATDNAIFAFGGI